LILDEVTAGLDPIVRDDFLNLLQEFVSDGAHSILISSHILSDLEKICDYITFLHKGQLLFSMEKEQLMETYGIIRCSLDDAEALPEACICAKRTSAYGAEVLVKRQHAPNWVPVEEVSMEDLMVLLVKYAE
jgi:ABC-2 type transport system ATP-binding protein